MKIDEILRTQENSNAQQELGGRLEGNASSEEA